MTNILVVIYIISSFNLKSTFSSLSASWGRRSLASTKESIVGNLIFTCNQFVMIAVFFFPIKQFFVENIIFGILKIFQRKETKIGKHLARDKSVDQQCGEVDVAHHLIMMMMMMMIDY